MMTETPAVQPRRRAASRVSTRSVAQKTKVTLVLDDDAAKRLAVYAALTDQERSQVVNQLIREHLKRFRVQDLARPEPPDSAVEDRQESQAA